jgi:hypothetical protein
MLGHGGFHARDGGVRFLRLTNVAGFNKLETGSATILTIGLRASTTIGFFDRSSLIFILASRHAFLTPTT